MFDTPSSPLLVGRTVQLGRVQAFARQVAAAEGGALLLRGEAGAGKTRLARELAAEARRGGTEVLVGACVAVGEEPLRHAALAEIVRSAPRRGFGAQAGSPVGGLATDAMLERVLTLVEQLIAETPVLLVVEDLHWADRGTCEILTVLCRHAHGRPAGIVMTSRDDELPRAHHVNQFLGELLRAQLAAPVSVPALSALEVAQLVEQLLGDVDATVVARIYERSGGNPLLVEELCAAVVDGDSAGVSPLADVMLARFLRLSEPARNLVRAVAVAGSAVSETELAGVIGGAAEFAPALREALDLHVLVRSDNAIGFRHVLMADAVYGELLGVERTELHRRWAGELESVPAAVPRLAYHWYEAGAYEPAFDASLMAARDSGAVLAFDSAYHHFRRALAVWDRVANPAARAGSSRVDLCLAAAEAANWSGDPAAAVGMIDVALALPEADDPEWGSVLLERRGWYLLRHGENAAARQAYESALATLPVTAEPAVRTRVLAGSVRAYERAADFDRALELAREAVTIAVETEASTEIGPAHYMLGRILLTIGDVDGALTELDHAARAAEETLNPVMLAIALLERGDALARRGRLGDAVPAALDAAARLQARGHVDPFALLAAASAAALLNRLGRPAEGRALAAEILDTARSPVTLAVGHLLAGAFDVEALHVDAAREHLETARFLATPLLDGRVGAALATARAELALVDGNATSAMGAVEEGLARVAHTGDDEAYAHLCLLGLRIEAERNFLTLGRASERSQRYRDAKVDELERGLQRVLDAWPVGADRPDLAAIRTGWAAERTRLDGAPDPAAWARAATGWAAAGWPRWAAYAALGRAEALAARGDDVAVTAALDDARTAAAALDSALLLAHGDRLAHRLGHTQPPTPPRTGAAEVAAGTVDALTAREREVLDLVAAGATNRQIAARLFISPKTASVHVSRILTKLGVADRAEAAVLARRANRAPRG